MTEPTISAADRSTVQILAFAAREFDRVNTLLLEDDEPTPAEVGVEATAEESQEKKQRKGGLLGAAFGVVGAVAGGLGKTVAGVHPRHPDWQKADVDERIDWWVERLGTGASVIAAVPGLAGKLGKFVGVGDLVAAAAQILVVNAVAHEVGVTDLGRRVEVAARIVLGRELDAAAVAGAVDDPEAKPDGAPAGDAPEEKSGLLGRAGRSAALVWRVAGQLRRLRSDIENRPQGGLFARAASNLPGVGAAASFFSERSGIAKAAREAQQAFTA